MARCPVLGPQIAVFGVASMAWDSDVVTIVIERLIAGIAIDLALKGVRGGLRAFREQPDSLGRLLVLLHAEFGHECDLGRDVFYSWRNHDELRAAFERVLAGDLLPGRSAPAELAILVAPRLIRTADDVRHELAVRVAQAVFDAAPVVVEGATEANRLLLGRLAARERDWRALTPHSLRFNLPAVVAAFAGREAELRALDRALAGADAAVIAQAITGLGGVGKSQLAARYVQQRASSYDVVAWIRAEDGGTADLGRLATRLHLPVDELSPGDRAQLAIEWLSETAQRWLLVLDNVESAEQLKGLLPCSGNGHALVTSRDHTLRQFGPMLILGVFDEDTATAYLADRAGRQRDQRAARQLARALGCLPLALSHAAAYCEHGTSFTDYLNLLGELPARDLFDSNPELFYAQTVASTWKPSIQAASTVTPLAADVLEMAAHVGPDAIPKSLFSVLIGADTAIARKRLADALNALARFSLATTNDDDVSVHRLLQKIVRDDAASRKDRAAASHALIALSEAFPDKLRLPVTWPLCERLLPHVLALANAFDQPGEEGPKLISLLNRACDYLDRVKHCQRELPTARIALQHANRVLGSDHPRTLITRSHLARAYRNVGQTSKAIDIFELLQVDEERVLGTEHPEVHWTRHSLARAYQRAGRVDEAIAIYEPLLAHRQQVLGGEHLNTLITRHNLAGAYLDAGRIGEAITICEPLLADEERVLGPAHPDTLTTRHSLASAYHDAGRTGEAITIYERLLSDRERVLGPSHPYTLTTRYRLARAYHDVGRVAEAIAIYEQLIPDREQILGAEHPETRDARETLAEATRQEGRIGDVGRIRSPVPYRERRRGIPPA